LFDGGIGLHDNSFIKHDSRFDCSSVIDNDIVTDEGVFDLTVASDSNILPDDAVFNLSAVTDGTILANDTLFDTSLKASFSYFIRVEVLKHLLISLTKSGVFPNDTVV
jgi:hypothetical protein